MPSPEPPAGYSLVREIGSGGFGSVWLARSQTGLWRAVKVVASASPDDRDMFRRELAGITRFQAATLGQPTQLAILHVEVDDSQGLLRYVMELADDASGEAAFDPESYVPLTLKELRHRRGRLPVAEVARIGVHVARGLAFLHSKGLLHRDVKPSNVIMVGGVPKLSDLGLVTSSETAVTQVGTQGYVAPEGPGTPAADLYSLGLVLYELATDQSPGNFPCLPTQAASWHDAADFASLNDILLRACSRDPALRHASASDLADDLAASLTGRSITAMDAARRRWRRRGLAALAALGMVTAASAVALREANVAKDRESLAATRRQFAVLNAFHLLQQGNPAAALAQWRSVPQPESDALPAAFFRGQIQGDTSLLLAQADTPWTHGRLSASSDAWMASTPDGRVAWGSLQSNRWAWVPGVQVNKIGPWRPGGTEAWVVVSNRWHALRPADGRLSPPPLEGDPEAASPDGAALVTLDPAATNIVLRVWREFGPAPIDLALPAPRERLLWASVAPGGERLAAAWFDITNGLRARRLASWILNPPGPPRIKAVDGWIWGLHAATNGRALYIADGRRATWHDLAGDRPANIEVTADWIRSSTLAPNGTTWVAGMENGRVRWHDVAAGNIPAEERAGHVGPVRDVAWLGGDAPVVSFGHDGTIRRWPARRTGNAWEGTWTGEFGDAVPGPGGTNILATKNEGAVAVLDAATLAEVGEVTGAFQPLEASTDGRHAWYLGPGLALQRRSWPTHALEWTSPPATDHAPSYVIHSPGHVLVGSDDGRGAGFAIVLKLDTQAQARRIPVRSPPVAMALHPEGDFLACSFSDGSVEVLSMGAGTVAWNLPADASARARVTALKWSPSGSRLAAGRSDGVVLLYQTGPAGAVAAAPRPDAVVQAHAGHVIGIAWDTADDGFLTIADDGFLRFWKADDLRPAGSWRADPDGLATVNLDLSGRQCLTLGWTGRVRRWPLPTGGP